LAYKYFDIISNFPPTSASAILVNDFQSLLNDQFAVATDYYNIQEETTIGSGLYTNINVRITGAIDSVTGEKLSDDFKQILFEDITHDASLGKKFYFDNNYWLCSYSETLKTLSANCMVRRLNNMLRWVDENGNYYEEECALEYKISRPRDEVGTVNPVLPAGYVDCLTQMNSKTVKIKGNQRFLFGPVENRICFRVFGDGVVNYMNQQTLDDSSSQVLHLSMGGWQIYPDVDDLTNGIADRYKSYPPFTSGSSIGALSIQITPNNNKVYQGDTENYTVNYCSGSSIIAGSFVFSISGSSIPIANYTLTTLGSNSFSLKNNQSWLSNNLLILCSGSSGSRILDFKLRREW
jgi:hypothetical protein